MRKCQLYEDLRQVVSQRCRNAILNFNPLAQWPSQGLSGLFSGSLASGPVQGQGHQNSPQGHILGWERANANSPDPGSGWDCSFSRAAVAEPSGRGRSPPGLRELQTHANQLFKQRSLLVLFLQLTLIKHQLYARQGARRCGGGRGVDRE